MHRGRVVTQEDLNGSDQSEKRFGIKLAKKRKTLLFDGTVFEIDHKKLNASANFFSAVAYSSP